MPGTIIGGKRAARKNKELYGSDYYARIGKIGGQSGHTGGFASPNPCPCDILNYSHRKAECAGYIGGRVSKRKAYAQN